MWLLTWIPIRLGATMGSPSQRERWSKARNWLWLLALGVLVAAIYCFMDFILHGGRMTGTQALSVFLGSMIAVPVYGTMGTVMFRKLRLAGLGQSLGALAGAIAGTQILSEIILSAFGLH